MLSLGIITKVRDHDICVNLPGRTSGHVSITDISTPYLKVIESLSEGTKDPDDDVSLLLIKIKVIQLVFQNV